MVLRFTDKVDGKYRYIKQYGNFYVLTKNKKGALEELNSDWEVITLPSGHLKLRKRR